MQGIAGRVAIVTGGASGLGAGIARAFADAQANVVIADIADEAGAAVAAGFGPRGHFLHTDLRSDDDIAGLVAHAAEALGGIDFLVNCACSYADQGIATDRATWLASFDVNVFGHVMLVQAARAHLARSARPSVVNFTSVAAQAGLGGRAVYPASKAAIEQVTRSQALDLAADRIRVNAVMPAWIAKPGPSMPPDAQERYDARARRFHLPGRVARMDEVTDAVLFLCSEHAGFITGSILRVDGGHSQMGPQGREVVLPTTLRKAGRA